MNTKFLILIIFITILLIGINSVAVAVTSNDQDTGLTKNKLTVSYANNTAQKYEVSVDSHKKYTISQSHSWVRDQTSRYNLISYSIDGNNYTPISRLARGNFTLDMTMDLSHSVVFAAVPQYPIDVTGSTNMIFSPTSPTNDNWFDANSEITVSVPNTVEIKQGKTREQLTGWSIDGSKLRTIQRTESSMFTTPVIRMSSMHSLDFTTVTQHYIEVSSQYGTTTGEGWHDAGSMVTVTVKPPDEFLARHVLAGWEGSKIKPNGQSATLMIDSPSTIIATWTTDYSQLVVLGIIPVGVAAFIVIRRRNKQAVSTVTTEIKQQEVTSTEVKLQPDDNYPKEITDYVIQKSIEKLDSMHASGLLSDTRYSQIKENLQK